MKFRYPVYDPVGDLSGLHRHLHWPCDITYDLDLALAQPYRVATMPAFFNDSFHWPGSVLLKQNPNLVNSRFDQFDLVLVTDVEFRHWDTVKQWMDTVGIGRFLFVANNVDRERCLDPLQELFKPYWLMYTAQVNSHVEINDPAVEKPWLFEAMLGARRPHRDYVMLAMTHSGMLDRSVVNYRDFPGGFTDVHTQEFKDIFPNTVLNFPYISPNYNPTWELVQDVHSHNVNFPVPTNLYNNTHYSIVCESTYTGNMSFLSEKTGKVLLAQRAAVWFAPEGFLKCMRDLGFETFGDVIDESYDHDDYHRDWKRFERAWSSVEQLSKCDPVQIYKKLQPKLEHNRNHLMGMTDKFLKRWDQVMLELIPSQHWST